MSELMNNFTPTYEALSIIYGTMESDSETFKSFVTSGFMMESNMPDEIVMESVTDIFKSIANGIKKFITKVKEFFKKILLYITSSHQDLDKLSNEVKKIVDKLDDVDFTIDGYKFTVMDKNGPDMTEFRNIVSKYNDDMSKVSSLKEKEIKEEILDWLEEKHLDRLRGEVLGARNSIQEEDYLSEVRKFFRNGEDSTSTITVNKSMVNDIINHSKKIEELKKASIKDRDDLLSLLTKTETFFDRTIQTYYKGDKKEINANKVNIDNNKFSKEDNKITVDDNLSKIISMYATYKAKQVNKIASMINLVACERVNAIKDQISMERTILRKCLFGKTSDKKEDNELKESFNIHDDYSIMAMESDIRDYSIYENLLMNNLICESFGIIKSLNENSANGIIEYCSLMEADRTKVSGKIKQTISDAIDLITDAFCKKAIGNSDKYVPWIEDIMSEENKLTEKANSKKEFIMAKFVTVETAKTQANKLATAIRNAYSNKDYSNISWASGILPSLDSVDKLNDTNMRTSLMNFYCTGDDKEEISKLKLSGNQLAGKMDSIVKYIREYKSFVQPIENIKKQIKSSSNDFKLDETVTDSTYFDIIGKSIFESDIVLCRDYNEVFGVMEAEETSGTEGARSGDAAKSVKNATNSVKNETQTGNDIKSVTQVKSVDDPNKQSPDEAKKTSSDATRYKRMIDGFFKRCISYYLIAREQQFIGCVRALSEIDGAAPKFDENGKYIPKANRTKDKNKENEVTNVKSK